MTTWTGADPGVGDCVAILALSADLGEVAQVAGEARGQLQALHAQLNGVDWAGSAADAFRDRIGKLPVHLAALTSSYQAAAEGLRGYSAAVGQIQDQLRAARVQLSSAQADHDRAVTLQSGWVAPLVDSTTGLRTGGGVNPYDEQVAAAHTSIVKASTVIANLADDRRVADGRAMAALHGAHEKGLKNASGWTHFWDAAERDAQAIGTGALHDLDNAGQLLKGIGQYYWHNPAALVEQLRDDAGLVAGTLGLTLAAGGEVAGLALDATGVGAVAGVPINIASLGLAGASLGLMGMSADDSTRNITKAVDAADESIPDDVATPAPKPWRDSRGSTGRTAPGGKNEIAAISYVEDYPEYGNQLSITMNDPVWSAEDGWVKMEQTVDGIEVHYVYNLETGESDDFKFKDRSNE